MGVLFLGVLIIRALLVGVYVRAPILGNSHIQSMKAWHPFQFDEALHELLSIIPTDKSSMNGLLYTRGRHVIPAQKPMSILNMALPFSILTVVHMTVLKSCT